MMKVGYTAIYGLEEKKKLLNAGVNEIFLRETSMNEIESFAEFLDRNKDKDVVLVSLASIGPNLTTRNMLDILLFLRKNKRTVHVIDQGIEARVSDFQYRDLLIKFAETDQAAIKLRTKEGLEKARINGNLPGRPRITKETAERIYFLYHTQKETIRQIAMDCNVSIGTVHKYANKSKR